VSKRSSQAEPKNQRFEDVLDGIRTHKLSLRRGAELMHMPYRAFLELMAAHRVPSIDYDAGWLEQEMQLFEEGSKQRLRSWRRPLPSASGRRKST
jgi:predicted HTH domain antitoxin